MNNQNFAKYLVILTVLGLLTACGSGGGGAAAPASVAPASFLVSADNGMTGYELFRTDGTAAGIAACFYASFHGSVPTTQGLMPVSPNGLYAYAVISPTFHLVGKYCSAKQTRLVKKLAASSGG
ncbi:MAG: hypothetical protein HZB47_13785 [Nitrosomonadales bacterium]|nr:hypothetical protein [Nitrosomonadales bacterium]